MVSTSLKSSMHCADDSRMRGGDAMSRLATWIRKDYPRSAPARGHCYLLALCMSAAPPGELTGR